MIPFDRIGARYDEVFTDRGAQLALGQRLLDLLPRGARVLDHGCGSGVPTARQLADAGLEVLGVDESTVMLELAAVRVPEATFTCCDLRDLGADLGGFDAVTSFFALLLLPRADIPEVLRGLGTRLHPGGLRALGMVAGDLDAVEIPFLGVPVAVSAYPSDALAGAVAAAGFTIETADEVNVATEDGRIETQQFLLAHRREPDTWPATSRSTHRSTGSTMPSPPYSPALKTSTPSVMT